MWQKRTKIGKGASGVVYFATNTETGQPAALKEICNNSASQREARIQQKFSHRRLCPVIETQVDKESNCLQIVMPFYGSNLLETLQFSKGFTEARLRGYIRQVITGVSCLHRHGYFHGDIKLENILISNTNSNVVICDFGFSERYKKGSRILQRKLRQRGSPRYLPPEIFLRKTTLGPELDIWEIGVLAYVLCAGRFPFGDLEGTKNSIARDIVNAHDIHFPSSFSRSLRSFCEMIFFNPGGRVTDIELLAEHPWVLGFS